MEVSMCLVWFHSAVIGCHVRSYVRIAALVQ
jgi:hypothetical protein